jgi:putative endonuclease
MSDIFTVYVLRSQSNGKLYVGSTSNLPRRFHEHNSGQSASTTSGIPWAIVHTEEFESRSFAVQRERYFKTGKGRDELKRLLG